MTAFRLAALAGLMTTTALLSAPAGAAPFTLLIYETPAELSLRTATDAAGAGYWGGYKAFADAAGAAGILRGGSPLDVDDTAVRSVRLSDGAPVIETPEPAVVEERLGGYLQIEVPDLDSAVAWAARVPAAATGRVEVRPGSAVAGM